MKSTQTLLRLPPANFVWMGVVFAGAFWFVDSVIDVTFFSDESYLESLTPSGMELYMRLLICVQLVVFGLITAKYVEANNQVNKYLELKLREDCQRYRILSDMVPIAIVTLNIDLMIIDWSPGAQKIFGWEPSEALGRDFRDLLFPEQAAQSAATLNDLFNQTNKLAVSPSRSKTGQMVSCEWRYAPIKDDLGHIGSVMAMGTLVSGTFSG